MKLKQLNLAMLLGGLAVGPSLWAAEAAPAADSPRAIMLSNMCGGCHGTDGASAGLTMPTIGGQSKRYITDAMKAFKTGEWPSTIMGRIAKGYSDDDAKLMADFFSKKEFVRHEQAFDQAKVAKGRELHQENCKKCHPDGGRTAKDGGVTGGQWGEYLQITFKDYLDKKRPMTQKMAEKFHDLSKEDVDALIQFYASQQ